MESECSLPLSQVPATCTYHETDRSNPSPHIPFPEDPSYYYPSIYTRGLPSGLCPSGFPTKTLYTLQLSPIPATYPFYLIILDMITRTILGEQYRLLSSSLCSFLHSPVTSSLLGPHIEIFCHSAVLFVRVIERIQKLLSPSSG